MPQAPLDPGPRLEPIAENLWGAEHDLFLPGGVHFRGRMTVVRLAHGGLVLHSPIPIDTELSEELAQLGPVEHVVAPNSMHHVHLTSGLQRYPQARLYGPGLLAKKRSDLTFLDVTNPDTLDFGSEFRPLHIRGVPKLDEVVFLHAPTQTLVVTDYFFNIRECQGWLTPWVLRMTGTYRRFAQSRLWRWVLEDRPLAQTSAEELLAWRFQRIVPAHGEVVSDNAHEQAENALAWLLGKAPKALPHPS